MHSLLSLLGLSTQRPFFQGANISKLPSAMTMPSKSTFTLKEGVDVFSPNDLVTLSRPGAGVSNDPGDLVLVPVSKYSFEEKK
jgi:hypothetical protein